MRKNRSAALAAASFLLMTGAGIAAAPSAYAGTPGGTHANDRNSDFNGDGYEDVLVGAPGATVSGKKGAGLVTVQYGSSRGIGTTNAARFSQSTADVAGAAETGDAFGRAVATGDLDGDGYDDAIVGVPGEDLGTTKDAGGVAVLWGSKSGLSGAASDWLETQEPTADEQFGSALAAAHFTDETPGDLLAVLDRDDLELFGYDSAAQASLKQRSQQRLSARADQRDILPTSLTTGDYDDNGYADLVVSGVTVGDEPGHGWSSLLTGHADGLSYERDLRGGPVAASGDINNDGYDDLVTGEPHSPTTCTARHARAVWSACVSAARTGPRPIPTGGRRSRPAYPAPRRSATAGAPTCRSRTPMATGTRTWRSAPPARTSARWPTRAPCGCCAARPAGSPRPGPSRGTRTRRTYRAWRRRATNGAPRSG
ncbi:hypothetical protein SAV14893_002200 [Streptomyces avermitilis]|uniref:Integrin-like protein n=1 Tax=Streptomyces avermitilis TaxID=33903 RepID=A0A4D4LRP4_STRAX|nr:hypothetical protein SAV14893_002200 [Streptomyces avermitilis]